MKTGKLYKGLDWSVNIIIVLLSAAVAIFVYVSPKPSGYGYMYLHPLIFAIFYHKNLPLKEEKFSRPCLLFLFLTMLIRYVAGPLLMVLADYPLLSTHDSSSTNTGILLMCYEEIVVFLIISWFGRKYKRDSDHINRGELKQVNESFFLFSIVSVGAIILFFYPEVANRYHFLFSLSGNEYDLVNENTAAILPFFVDMSRYIILLLIVSSLSRRYNITNNPWCVFLTLLVIVFNMLWVYDISRFSVVISAIVLTYLIIQIYPKYKRSILNFSLVSLLFVIGVATAVKTFSQNPGDAESASEIVEWSNLIQMYFMGQRDVGLGIYVADRLPGLGIYYMFNDAIQQIMFLNKFHISQLDFSSFYNYEYNNGPWIDKIVPNVCAGYLYFGKFLSPLITGVSVFLSLYFDRRSLKTNKIADKFLMIYASLMCSLIMMQFYPMVLCVLINTILPLFVVLKVSSLLEIKR